jgi:MscS family membrane protein
MDRNVPAIDATTSTTVLVTSTSANRIHCVARRLAMSPRGAGVHRALALPATVSLAPWLRALAVCVVLGLILHAISRVQARLMQRAWAEHAPEARTLVPLGGKLARVVAIAAALLVILTQFGYSVSTLLAGIGIGGVALALASQKTMEHLFGSVALTTDEVFRVGDFVRVGDVEGTVERVGLRSTSVRTVRRTMVRIPNGKLAEDRIETFSERDRFLFQHDFLLPFTTPSADVRSITRALDDLLVAHARVWQAERRVDVVAFAESGIRMRVMCWLTTPSWSEFMTAQHYLLLSVKQVVEAHGHVMAVPTQRVEWPAATGEPMREAIPRAPAPPAATPSAASASPLR